MRLVAGQLTSAHSIGLLMVSVTGDLVHSLQSHSTAAAAGNGLGAQHTALLRKTRHGSGGQSYVWCLLCNGRAVQGDQATAWGWRAAHQTATAGSRLRRVRCGMRAARSSSSRRGGVAMVWGECGGGGSGAYRRRPRPRRSHRAAPPDLAALLAKQRRASPRSVGTPLHAEIRMIRRGGGAAQL